MNAKISAPKGVPEYLPPDSATWLAIQGELARPAVNAGYGYVELPVFEDTALFVRGVGESTDVVSKEMYTFTDRGDRSLTLRPEGTAGVIRTVIEHGLDRGPLPVSSGTPGRSSAPSAPRPAATGSSRASASRRSAPTTRPSTPRSSPSPSTATAPSA